MRVSVKRAIPILLCLLAVPGSVPGFAASPRWTLLGPDGGQATVVAVAPSNPTVVYATGQEQEGIFRSLDRGTTWSWPEQEALTDADLATRVIAVDPRRPGTVWLGSQSSGLTRSTDGGVTWSAFQRFGIGNGVDAPDVSMPPSSPGSSGPPAAATGRPSRTASPISSSTACCSIHWTPTTSSPPRKPAGWRCSR